MQTLLNLQSGMRATTGVKLAVMAVVVSLLAGLQAIGPDIVRADGGGIDTLTVLVINDGTASELTAGWTDTQECSAGYNIYIDGADTSATELPEGATVSDSGRIHAASAGPTSTQDTSAFPAINASEGVAALTVSAYCGSDESGRLVATVNDVGVDPDTRRPLQGSYSSEPSINVLPPDGISELLEKEAEAASGLLVANSRGNILNDDDYANFEDEFSSMRVALDDNARSQNYRVGFDSTGTETHSYISTTIADNGTTGSTFTITWVDAETCTGNYHLYMDNIDPVGVGLPSGATQDLSTKRVNLGSVAATTDPLQLVSTFTTVKAVSTGDHIFLWVYCGSDDSARKVESYELPVDGTSLRPVAGTYSSTPGITEFQINDTVQTAFDPYKTHEEYYYIWNVGDATQATIKLTLNDGYSATYKGSTKSVYSIIKDDVDQGKYAIWYINGTVAIEDGDAMEDDFQFVFDDNDPNGTDQFQLNVSQGDYHAGHHYRFFVIRRATVTGPTMLDYAENGDDAVGTYSIPAPEKEYSWTFLDGGDDEEDDQDDFNIEENDDGNAVLSFASSPDFETPTDGNPDDTTTDEYQNNVYHIRMLGWETNPILDRWTGNYYGYTDVEVTVTDVDPE